MLTELQRLHAEIKAALDELARLTALAEPPMSELPLLRLRLTRASRARTLLLESVYDQLIAHASTGQREAIQALKAAGKANMAASAQHIGSWTIREITARWADYCDASNSMRAAMRCRAEQEASILYPLLSAGESIRPTARSTPPSDGYLRAFG